MSAAPQDVTTLTKRERAIRRRLRDDFPHYAQKSLKIRPKAGGLVPFRLNKAQLYIHDKIEQQLDETGRVRVLIVKARQEGASTYTEGRFYWKVSHRKGVRAFILTHEDDATQNLFDMADRFYENSNPILKPHLGASNAKELYFDALDSGYRVGTARTKGKGRSQTIQYFHGSEVAFWPNAADHMAGIMQAVPKDAPGTEIILESTGNGIQGLFYNMVMDALAGKGDYILIFIPWYWHDEYKSPAPADWSKPEAFSEYQQLHGLSDDQLYWAYIKNGELARSLGLDDDELCWLFRQEYPATVKEAFQAADTNSYISAEVVERAAQNTVDNQDHAPLILGCDVSGGINDKTWIIDRQGRKAGGKINLKFKESDQMVIAGRLARIIDDLNPDMVFIDVGGGYGSGVYDRLCELGYERKLTPVQFGGKASNDRDYANKRAEMYGELKDWLEDPGGADIPQDEELHMHILSVSAKYDSNDRVKLRKKEDIKAEFGFSPDGSDALGLTFAEPVHRQEKQPKRRHHRSGGWMGN